jgi:hypothetical protein
MKQLKKKSNIDNNTKLLLHIYPDKIKVDKKLLKKLKPYWKEAILLECEYIGKLYSLEQKMSIESGIKDLEVFFSDGTMVGIGDYNRKMRLIHAEEIESGKIKDIEKC